VLVHPGFLADLGRPSASRKGLITAIYYLGTWTSYVFLSQPLNDRLGRRYASFIGMLVTSVGTAFQAGATGGPNGSLAMVITGRILAGAGNAVVSTSVPLYQSEIAPARHRGRYVVLNHVGFVFGLAVGFWAGYGVTFWTGDDGKEVAVGWRFSLSLVFIPAVIYMVGVPFLKET
jgi:MFS family permease